jgi:hypothetical protein
MGADNENEHDWGAKYADTPYADTSIRSSWRMTQRLPGIT